MEENRMTGKTTRAVDYAIQVLFTEGMVHIPDKLQIEDPKYSRGKDKNQIVIDPDWKHDKVQSVLLNRVRQRLIYEHGMRIEHDNTKSNFGHNGTTIFIKDPKFIKNGVQ